MKTIKLMAFGLLAALALLTSSCNEKGNPEYTMFMAFVTYEGSTDAGSKFTTRENGDSPLVTFTSTTVLKEEQYPKGTRYIIGYTNESEQRFQSGPISLMAIIPIANGPVHRATKQSIEAIYTDMVQLTLLQRTGKFINIEAVAPVQFQPKQFGLYVDDTTMGNEIPDVYVGFESDNTGGAQRQFYGSFDISSLWDLPTCKGIKIHYHSNGMEKDFIYEKPAEN